MYFGNKSCRNLRFFLINNINSVFILMNGKTDPENTTLRFKSSRSPLKSNYIGPILKQIM